MAASLFLPLWLGMFGAIGTIPIDISPELVQARFETAARHLDSGGDLYTVKSIAGQMEGMVKMMGNVAGTTGPGNDSQEAARFLSDLETFLQDSGLFGMHTVAGSTVPRKDGLRDIKLFIGRDTAAATKPLWTGLTGGAPASMQFLPSLPDSCVLALETSTQPEQIWGLVRKGMLLFGCQGDSEKLAAQLRETEAAMGVSPDVLFASLTGGLAITMYMDPAKTTTLPMPGQALTLPEPGFIIAANAKDDTVLQFFLHVFARKGMHLSETTTETGTSYQLAQPLPAPIPMQPAVSLKDGRIYLASTPALLQKALTAPTEATLASKAAFSAAFGDKHATGNAFFYCDSRLRKSVRDIFQALPEQSNGNSPMKGVMALLDPDSIPAVGSYWVLQNTPEGLVLSGTGNGNGIRQLVSGNPATPAILAGILLPALNQARNRAHSIQCRANLRQIDIAKKAWANANNSTADTVPTTEDLKPYLGNPNGFACPKGGQYQINSMNQNPSCSYPGHSF